MHFLFPIQFFLFTSYYIPCSWQMTRGWNITNSETQNELYIIKLHSGFLIIVYCTYTLYSPVRRYLKNKFGLVGLSS